MEIHGLFWIHMLSATASFPKTPNLALAAGLTTDDAGSGATLADIPLVPGTGGLPILRVSLPNRLEFKVDLVGGTDPAFRT